MANLQDVLSVIIAVRFKQEEWQHIPTALKEFFTEHGNVYPLPQEDLGETDDQFAQLQRRPEEVFLGPEQNCGLTEVCIGLCGNAFQAFSVVQQEKGQDMELRLKLCPSAEVSRKHPRPLAEMQEVFGLVCAMVGLDLIGYDKPYIKPGRVLDKDWRALTLSGRNPNWLLNPDGQPAKRSNGKLRRVRRQVDITPNGNVIVRDA